MVSKGRVTPSVKDAPSPVAGYAEPERRPPFLPYLGFMTVSGRLAAQSL